VTRDDIVRLLQTAAAYDNRTIGEGPVRAWFDSAERGRWTYPEAVEAIKAHYAESTAFLMPAHVSQRIKATRQDAAMRNPIDPPDRAGQARLAELISGAFQTIPDDWRDDAINRRCSSCGAESGTQCTRVSDEGRVPTRIPHPARMKSEAEVK
jgi:hypothetical protein